MCEQPYLESRQHREVLLHIGACTLLHVTAVDQGKALLLTLLSIKRRLHPPNLPQMSNRFEPA